MLRVQKNYIDLEMRKFRRKKMVLLHELENQLLRDVRPTDQCLIYFNRLNKIFSSTGVEQETAAAGTSPWHANKTP